tara:strand:- start:74 stop:1318 length:1245 start_codon:yes stop_codon:yes gene_type:complete
MAELRQNTWSLDEWYDQNVAGTSGGYQFGGYQYAQGGSNMRYLLNAPGPSSRRSSPVLVNGGSGEWQFVKYQRGIKKDGSLWAWGNNNNGELGQGQSKNQLDSVSSPIQIGTNTTWKYITGFINNYAIKGDNTLWTWGRGTHGSLGLNQGGSLIRISSPTQIPGSWATISTGDESGFQTTLGTKTDGTLWSWGYGGNGGLGLGNRTQRSSPTQVGTDTSWSTNTSDPAARQTVDVGVGCQFAIKANGTLWSWGSGNQGQLGKGSQPANYNRSSPVQVGTETTWKSIHAQNSATGIRCVFSTKTNGTLYAWGANTHGGLGQNNRTTYSSPKQIPGTTWTSATYGISEKGHFMNIKTDGTYWTWGQNYFGTLGLNQSGYPNQKSRSSPTQVGTDTTWFATGAHSELIWALRHDSGT